MSWCFKLSFHLWSHKSWKKVSCSHARVQTQLGESHPHPRLWIQMDVA